MVLFFFVSLMIQKGTNVNLKHLFFFSKFCKLIPAVHHLSLVHDRCDLYRNGPAMKQLTTVIGLFVGWIKRVGDWDNTIQNLYVFSLSETQFILKYLHLNININFDLKSAWLPPLVIRNKYYIFEYTYI